MSLPNWPQHKFRFDHRNNMLLKADDVMFLLFYVMRSKIANILLPFIILALLAPNNKSDLVRNLCQAIPPNCRCTW